jgi:WD40 repeat protein
MRARLLFPTMFAVLFVAEPSLWAQDVQPIATLKGHDTDVRTLAFTPDGKTLASSGELTGVKLWDVATVKERAFLLCDLVRTWAVAFTADGKTMISAGEADKNQGEITLWDVAKGKDVRTIQAHKEPVKAAAITPDGKTVASGSVVIDRKKPIEKQFVAGELKLWVAATGKERANLKGHTSMVTAVVFTPDSNKLISASLDNTIRSWDVATGKELLPYKGHTGPIRCLAISADGKTLASSADDNFDMNYQPVVRLWDVATGKELALLKGFERDVMSMAFTPDGKSLVTGGLTLNKNGLDVGLVKVWDVATRMELLAFQGHTGQIYALAITADGTTLATGSADETVKLWDLAKLLKNKPK